MIWKFRSTVTKFMLMSFPLDTWKIFKLAKEKKKKWILEKFIGEVYLLISNMKNATDLRLLGRAKVWPAFCYLL